MGIQKIYYKGGLLMEIRRDYYLEKLIKRKNNGLIKVITGIRYCGKSYLLNKLFYNHLIESGVVLITLSVLTFTRVKIYI